jgi:hypothetical protein
LPRNPLQFASLVSSFGRAERGFRRAIRREGPLLFAIRLDPGISSRLHPTDEAWTGGEVVRFSHMTESNGAGRIPSGRSVWRPDAAPSAR